MADVVMKKIGDKTAFTTAIDFFWKVAGDKQPSSYNAGEELTRAYMEKFNRETADCPGVYYQSYAGKIDGDVVSPVWRKMHAVIYEYEGENDGLVSVESAKWGAFRGVMSCGGQARVAHCDEIGMHHLSAEYCFDSDAFYVDVVHELKQMGF